ncbi:hypothetical protein POVWA2_049170 [Plasmodium ovale wallikeri]|uniref:Uncharacterized protein n=1 Tax=Plasmodium ovale wallikeri TaxID=864142 RepID=A0A1A8ZME9_PLAOA|nr:hypothetical protein POVWA2_049170 [Plasmodium ovale wallikeri]
MLNAFKWQYNYLPFLRNRESPSREFLLSMNKPTSQYSHLNKKKKKKKNYEHVSCKKTFGGCPTGQKKKTLVGVGGYVLSPQVKN